jgi:hypothetical protein
VQQLADLKSNTLSANDSSAMSADDMSRKSKSFFTLSAVPGGRKITGIDTHGANEPYIAKAPDTIITDTIVAWLVMLQNTIPSLLRKTPITLRLIPLLPIKPRLWPVTATRVTPSKNASWCR